MKLVLHHAVPPAEIASIDRYLYTAFDDLELRATPRTMHHTPLNANS